MPQDYSVKIFHWTTNFPIFSWFVRQKMMNYKLADMTVLEVYFHNNELSGWRINFYCRSTVTQLGNSTWERHNERISQIYCTALLNWLSCYEIVLQIKFFVFSNIEISSEYLSISIFIWNTSMTLSSCQLVESPTDACPVQQIDFVGWNRSLMPQVVFSGELEGLSCCAD